MWHYLVRRIITALLVVFVVSVMTFAVLQWLPGDPAAIILGVNATPSALFSVRESLGLNQPWYVQYGHWLAQALTGNLGTSMVFGQPVALLIEQRLPVTLTMTLLSLVITMVIAIPLGVISAIFRHRTIDRIFRFVMQVFLGVPTFWVGLLLILWLSVAWHWLPVGGFAGLSAGIWPMLSSLLMPAVSLSIVEIAVLSRIMRRSMIDALDAPFMVTVRGKGLGAWRRTMRHAFRTALVVPVTIIGLQVASLLGGAVVVENVFALPGIGRLLLVAVQQKDYPLLEGLTVFIALIVVISSLIVDLLYAVLDPRIRLR